MLTLKQMKVKLTRALRKENYAVKVPGNCSERVTQRRKRGDE